MGIIYRREDKHERAAKGATFTYGSTNEASKPGIASIDNKPYEIKEGRNDPCFSSNVISGKTMYPHFAMHPTWSHSAVAGFAAWMWH